MVRMKPIFKKVLHKGEKQKTISVYCGSAISHGYWAGDYCKVKEGNEDINFFSGLRPEKKALDYAKKKINELKKKGWKEARRKKRKMKKKHKK